jgi:hypothetical protein
MTDELEVDVVVDSHELDVAVDDVRESEAELEVPGLEIEAEVEVEREHGDDEESSSDHGGERNRPHMTGRTTGSEQHASRRLTA